MWLANIDWAGRDGNSEKGIKSNGSLHVAWRLGRTGI
jgi:hypothetical protein